MRVFLDSNVLISAFISDGEIRQLRDRVLKQHEAFVSEEALSECSRKLLGKFKIDRALIEFHDRSIRRLAIVLDEQVQPPKVSRDPKDDWALAAAVSAHCHCILSGDADLTDLGSHQGIPILRPRDFLAFEAGRFKRRRQR